MKETSSSSNTSTLSLSSSRWNLRTAAWALLLCTYCCIRDVKLKRNLLLLLYLRLGVLDGSFGGVGWMLGVWRSWTVTSSVSSHSHEYVRWTPRQVRLSLKQVRLCFIFGVMEWDNFHYDGGGREPRNEEEESLMQSHKIQYLSRYVEVRIMIWYSSKSAGHVSTIYRIC